VSPGSTGPNDRTSEDWGIEQIVEKEYSQDFQPELSPDLDLDVPMLQIEELDLEVENLQLQVSLQTQLANFVNISAGVNAQLGKVRLAIKGVKAQARLKVRLEGTLETLRRALDTIDRNPQVLGGAFYGGEQRPGESGQRTEQQANGPPDAGDEGREREGKRGDEDVSGIKATDAAWRKAEELGVDLSRVQGTGSGGRIIIGDVKKAAR
jgi:pyruvate/2-oxoglutarate dehydrogenase complex dihydrolipoamide acyltransferase (E2) component